MKNRDLSFFLIPLMAAVTFYAPTLTGSGGSRGAEPAPTPAASPTPAATAADAATAAQPARILKDTESNAAGLLYQFLGVDRKTCRACEDDLRCDLQGNPSGQYLLEFMVATLPDPRESRLSYLFDRNLEAVQRAIEAAGFVIDRYDLPWQDRNGKPPTAEALQQPGVLLFRSTSMNIVTRCPSSDPVGQQIEKITAPGGRLLVLFLVGETPTSGINKPVLRNALDQIALLSRWKKTGQKEFQILPCLPFPERDGCQSPIAQRCADANGKNESGHEIRIMGPTFSGSEDSFELAIQSWLESSFDPPDRPIVSVISGSATSVNACKFCARLTTPGQPRFQSMVPLNQQALEAFRRYLLKLDRSADAGRIAILKEANTAYGQSSGRSAQRTYSLKKEERSQDKLDENGLELLLRGLAHIEKDRVPCPDPPNVKSEDSWMIELPFPLHISQLRVASEKAKSAQSNASPSLRGVSRPLLPLLLDDGADTTDIVPLFSKLQPASLEVELSRVLEELNRERVRYIGIVSTDVKDSIFLVSEIRKHCPNSMVFLFFADMIYFRPEVNLDLQGTVVITPYPLFGANQFWSYPFSGQDSRLQFSTHITQGAYNATLALLGLTDHLLEYGEPFEDPAKGESRIPSLWVTVVGRYGFMPVRLLPFFNDGYVMPLPKKPGAPGRPILNLAGGLTSKTSTTVILLLIALGLVIPVTTLSQLIRGRSDALVDRFAPTRELSNSWFGETFGDPVFVDYKLRKRFYLLLCCASLLSVYLPMMWVFLLPSWVQWQLPHLRGPGEQPFLWVKILIGAVMSISLLCAVWLWGSVAEWLVELLQQRVRSGLNLWRRLRKRPAAEGASRPYRRHTVSPVAIVASLIVVVCLLALGYELLAHRQPATHIFFFVRATDLTSGVSPLLPILSLGAAGFLASFCSLRRWNLMERIHRARADELSLRAEDLPAVDSFLGLEGPDGAAGDRGSFTGFREMEERILRLLSCTSIELPAWPLMSLLLLFPLLYVMFYRFIPTLEGPWFDHLFRLALALVTFALGMAFLRFVTAWIELRRFLRRLSCHPILAKAMHKEKPGFEELPRISLTTPAPNYTSISLSTQHAVQVCRQWDADSAPELAAEVRRLETNLHALLEAKAEGDWQTIARIRSESQARLAAISQRVVRRLEPAWSLPAADATAPSDALAQAGELFLAGRVLAFLHYVLAHLQNLVIFVNAGMLLLLLTVTSYPFQPRDLLLLFGWLQILAVVATTLFIFAQMDRDKVLSLFSGSVPGQLNWNRDFLLRITLHGVLPILALLSVQFPEALQQIMSWLSFLQSNGN